MAMPWSLAKEKQRQIESDPAERLRLTALFDACFRIQREAIEAAGHFIPLVVENVRGANKWVGRSRWNYGSFHLWGDVPALMPMTKAAKAIKNNGGSWFGIQDAKVQRPENGTDHIKQGGDWFNADQPSISRRCSSKSAARKAASARIAKIPKPLAQHIARSWLPIET